MALATRYNIDDPGLKSSIIPCRSPAKARAAGSFLEVDKPKTTLLRLIPDIPDPPVEGFFQVPNQLIVDRVGTAAVNVYCALAIHQPYVFPSIAELARLTKQSKSTVIRATNILVRKGYVTKRRRFNDSTIYTLRPVSPEYRPPSWVVSPEVI